MGDGRLRYDGTYAVHRWHHLWFGKHKDKDVKPWDRKEEEVRTCGRAGRVGQRRGILAVSFDDGSCLRQWDQESLKS
eukprot:COSAG01_NODE_7903_length_2999_cov_3.954483_2_plen_77_part_00